jgi:hypothetical protein
MYFVNYLFISRKVENKKIHILMFTFTLCRELQYYEVTPGSEQVEGRKCESMVTCHTVLMKKQTCRPQTKPELPNAGEKRKSKPTHRHDDGKQEQAWRGLQPGPGV